jgi:hypothetical protein
LGERCEREIIERKNYDDDEWHGTNAFIRDGDRVFRTYLINKPQVVLTCAETGSRPGFVCSYEAGVVSSRR